MLETVAFTGPMLDAGHWMLVTGCWSKTPLYGSQRQMALPVKSNRSIGVLEYWSVGLQN